MDCKQKVVIAGNWKMNKNRVQTEEFIEKLKTKIEIGTNVDVVLCVPFTSLDLALNLTKNTNLKVGAQNCHFELNGAFTGEVSAEMLVELGVKYVIIGHSERRQFFGETNETVNLRLKTALNCGLNVIVCVGETLSQRENKITNEIVALQLKIALKNVSAKQISKVIVAYEPVWAIGTGKVATSNEAQVVCELIRKIVSEMFGLNVAKNLVVQYGGSMNETNCFDLLSKHDINGGLIGGAALSVDRFAKIVKMASKI